MKGKKALCCHICFIVQVLRVWGSFIACFWAGQHHDLAAVPRALDQPYIRLSPKIQWPYTKMLSEYLQLSIGLLLHYLTFSFLVVNSERWQEASNQICRSVQKNIQRAKCYSHSHIKHTQYKKNTPICFLKGKNRPYFMDTLWPRTKLAYVRLTTWCVSSHSPVCTEDLMTHLIYIFFLNHSFKLLPNQDRKNLHFNLCQSQDQEHWVQMIYEQITGYVYKDWKCDTTEPQTRAIAIIR